ncbi:hypothetical protein Poli38472_009077 [Pythium oligandrum]|uniref:Cysteine dioxygenase n=1 Tax=Pythium oligandrum TaxID=41045 RepID=A0A8K1CLM7_PYTOL|nr:hypothetical protein Poli38472_009077 [Pythium oligandrum]|eukprot:TMW64910.1 hypothetical protein Poli38472_009077 [Pythium oligandrum]
MTRQTMTCSVTDATSESRVDVRSPNQVHRVKTSAATPAGASSESDNQKSPGGLSLSQLVDAIETQLKADSKTPINKRSVFRTLLEEYDGNMRELERFAYIDPSKNYTRNLISTDHETYALILLVWNRGKYSPIHDHPCDGCWVKVIQGTINEVQYQAQEGALVETSNVILSHGVTYMDDSIGLHKIGNPRDDVDAVTLHLYSPPYDKCRVWFDPNNADKSSVAYAYYFSEFGERADY